MTITTSPADSRSSASADPLASLAANAATGIDGDQAGGLPGKLEYRHAMSRLAAAVNIITSDGASGKTGFTASAVCSVTDEPPTLLVCLNRNASVYQAVRDNGVLCVNVLGPGQQELSNLFGGKTAMEQRYQAASWQTGVTGSPLLADAVASFDCRITSSAQVGSHDVLFCEVQAIHVGDTAHGLVYFDRRYHEILPG
ncbi:MAG: NADH-dependent FMN reductase RutF [Janthinobacterium lividum]